MIIELLVNTPLYVYWIFFSLLFVGIIQSKKREQGIIRALIIPFVLIFFSIYAFFQDFGINFISVFSWMIGIFFIIIINKFILNHNDIQYSTLNKVFTIEGSFLPLFMMMLLFFTKYTVTVLNILGSTLLDSFLYISLICLLYGIFSGMYIIRFYILVSKIKS